jgi:hypothetical protein
MEPELGQRREKDGEISSTVGGKKSGNVLNDEPSPISEKSVGDPCELEEESGSLAGEAAASSCDGEVLAGESSEEEVDRARKVSSGPIPDPPLPLWPFSVAASDGTNVLEARDSRPMSGKDFSSKGVLLTLEDDVDSRSVHPEVESSDA